MNFESVTLFESEVAKFFNAPYAVATDSCTHGVEICLRLKEAQKIKVPSRTYLSLSLIHI